MSEVTAPQPQAFDSGLTIPDFAGCLSMGLRPLGLVQGFFYGQISGWSSYSATVARNYPCVCMETAPHTSGWLGEVQALDTAWMSAHQTALERMLQEAARLGAHGVVGVTTEMGHPTNQNSCDVHLYGTAIEVEGAAPPSQPWSTQLAGHKLAKLIEIGFVPSSVVYARCTAMIVEGCYMEYYGSGRCGTGYVISPLQDAHELARSGAIRAAREVSPESCLYDVRMQVHETEGSGARSALSQVGGLGQGLGGSTTYVTCALLGSLVRRVRPTLSLSAPAPTVNLAS